MLFCLPITSTLLTSAFFAASSAVSPLPFCIEASFASRLSVTLLTGASGPDAPAAGGGGASVVGTGRPGAGAAAPAGACVWACASELARTRAKGAA